MTGEDGFLGGALEWFQRSYVIAVPLISHRTRKWIMCSNTATSEPSVKQNTRVIKMTSKEFGERIQYGISTL